jgi:hypothetical protein
MKEVKKDDVEALNTSIDSDEENLKQRKEEEHKKHLNRRKSIEGNIYKRRESVSNLHITKEQEKAGDFIELPGGEVTSY